MAGRMEDSVRASGGYPVGNSSRRLYPQLALDRLPGQSFVGLADIGAATGGTCCAGNFFRCEPEMAARVHSADNGDCSFPGGVGIRQLCFGWNWTGFQGNRLWEWINLLLLPVALAVVSISFKGYERPWATALALAAILLLVSAVGGYAFGWRWTGFQGNHLWDWLKLLVLPVALAVAQLTFKSDSGKKVPVTEAPTQDAPPEGATQYAASVEAVTANSAHVLIPSSTSVSEMTTPPAPRRRRGLLTALVALLIIVLVGSVLLSHFALATANVTHPAAPVAQVVGHAYFMNSEHGSGPNSQGVNDKFQINLSNIANPTSGKSYYAWLLPDGNHSEITSIALGTLNVTNGTASLQSPYIDPQRTNLLDNFSRLLITEEGSNPVPLSYSLDKKTWRYYAEIPQTPDLGDCSGSMNQLSDLCHLRHLLSNDPELQQVNLSGGLNYWFLNNVAYVQKRAGEAAHRTVPAHIRNKVMDILSVLDGPQCIQQDLQQASSSAPGVDNTPDDSTLNTFDTIPLLSCALTPSQPGYLVHIHNHLSALIHSSGVLADQVTLATQINAELNTMNGLLGQEQMDAQKLIGMDDHQLVHTHGHALLLEMEALTTRILNGGNDPTTNQPQPGVAQISSQIQQLATLDIKAYTTTQ